MKKGIKKILEALLSSRGFILLKKYEYSHLEDKYRESIEDTQKYFKESVFNDLEISADELSIFSKLYGTSVPEAFYLVYYLRLSIDSKGDVCEFGVGNGSTSRLLGFEIKKTTKKLFLFDSFEGLSKPTNEDKLINDMFSLGKMENYEGSMSYGQGEVLSKLNSIKFPRRRLRVVPGYIQESVKKNIKLNKVCFAYVDFDLYEPTKTALNFLKTKMSKNGFIVIDDYGYFSSGVKTALDEFTRENKEKYKLIMPKKFAGYFCILKRV